MTIMGQTWFLWNGKQKLLGIQEKPSKKYNKQKRILEDTIQVFFKCKFASHKTHIPKDKFINSEFVLL